MKPPLTIRKNRSSNGGGCYYAYQTPGECGYYHHQDIAHDMREREVIFDNMDQEEQDKLYLSIIHTFETGYVNHIGIDHTLRGDVQLLNRIIMNGGLIEYTRRLEANLKG